MGISKEDIKYISKLAKLDFTEKQQQILIKDLNEIMEYIDKLNEINTDNVDITVNPYYIENKYREDKIEESLSLEQVIENAPSTLKEYVLVPNVIE